MQLIQIIYEDDYILAVNKPPRVLSVPSSDSDRKESLPILLKRQLPRQSFFPLHRLDYGTSGVMLFGKDESHRSALEGIFSSPDTNKKYIALVLGNPKYKTGRITKPLPARTKKKFVPASTHYKVEQEFTSPPTSLISCIIDTGRKHQIRQHMASINHPIVMDDLYGNEKFNRQFRMILHLGRQFLHSESIDFIHPITKLPTHIEAPLTPDLQSIIKKLKSTRPVNIK